MLSIPLLVAEDGNAFAVYRIEELDVSGFSKEDWDSANFDYEILETEQGETWYVRSEVQNQTLNRIYACTEANVMFREEIELNSEEENATQVILMGADFSDSVFEAFMSYGGSSLSYWGNEFVQCFPGWMGIFSTTLNYGGKWYSVNGGLNAYQETLNIAVSNSVHLINARSKKTGDYRLSAEDRTRFKERNDALNIKVANYSDYVWACFCGNAMAEIATNAVGGKLFKNGVLHNPIILKYRSLRSKLGKPIKGAISNKEMNRVLGTSEMAFWFTGERAKQGLMNWEMTENIFAFLDPVQFMESLFDSLNQELNQLHLDIIRA